MILPIKDANGNTVYMSVDGDGTLDDPFSSGTGIARGTHPALYQFLDTVGDGSGSISMAVDGSITPVVFKLKPPAGQVYQIARVIFSLRDNAAMDAGGWGGVATPLTNGLLTEIKQQGVTESTLPPLKSHFDIAARSYDISHHEWGTGDEFVVARLTYTKAGRYLYLDGDEGDEYIVTIRDDISYLVEQMMNIQGKINIK